MNFTRNWITSSRRNRSTSSTRNFAASPHLSASQGYALRAGREDEEIFTDAVAVGNGTARAISFRNRDPLLNTKYPGSQWKTLFGGIDYQWLDDGGNGGRKLDARTIFYYGYTVNTPAMVAKLLGRARNTRSLSPTIRENRLTARRHINSTFPETRLLKNFWSVVLYDPQTRSQLQTGQPFPSKNDKRNSR